MTIKTMTAALSALVLCSAVQAQNCPCNGGAGTQITGTTSPTLTSLLTQRMVCGQVGGEKWQEYHASNLDLVDFKLGLGHPVDPTTKVGTYSVAGAVVTYNYGAGGGSYQYNVCAVGSPTTSYTFCGASFGGRDITNLIVGPAAAQAQAVSCTGLSPVSTSAFSSVTRTR